MRATGREELNMAKDKTEQVKPVTEADVNSALQEAKKLRQEEGRKVDAKREAQEKKAPQVQEDNK